MARICEGYAILSYLQAKRFVLHKFIVIGSKHGTLCSEAKDTANQGNCRGWSVNIHTPLVSKSQISKSGAKRAIYNVCTAIG